MRSVTSFFGVIAAIMLLIMFAPFLIVIAALIFINTRRSPIFRQQRLGRFERSFSIYKFRTMTDLRDSRGRLLPDEHRLTSLGRFLRRASLDEIPQLWNIARGNMAFVGPRPLLPEYLPRYSEVHRRRHEVKPGITGWAQINGRNALTWEEKFDLDVWYVDHWSLWLDVKILWLTLLKVLTQDGISQDGHATMPEFRGTPFNEHRAKLTVLNGNILISSAGRRVGLLECFRDSISSRRADRAVFAIDSGSSAPAAFISDGSSHVPRCTDPCFVDAVLQYCTNKRVGLVIPTIDTELPVYAAASQRFSESGVTVCISAPSTVQICCDKIATHDWLVANGFPTVRQTDLRTAMLEPSVWPLPLIAKPFNGSASIGVQRVKTRLELEAAAQTIGGCIVQEIAAGREFTINVYVNRAGECICTIPHWRMEVRAGEVSKGITVKDRRLMDIGRAVAAALPGAYGPLNIQCFMDENGTIRIIELNARFGGGYPLAHHAGGRFTDWLLDEQEGTSPSYFGDWTDDLAMLRYDEAVFVSGSRVRA